MEKVAVCISTSNREKEFNLSYDNWNYFEPSFNIDFSIFVVEDESDYSDADFRFESRAGVARVKNKCLELAMDWGADIIFLSDDDFWPKNYNWLDLYKNTGANHLMYNFYDKGTVHGKIKSHKKPSGCLLYFKRVCIEQVGGFDTNYGLYGWEHIDISRRIYNAGLTPYRYIDAVGSNNYFFSLDEHKKTKSTISKDVKDSLINSTHKYFIKQSKSKEFINYK